MNCVTPQSLNGTSAYICATLTGLKPAPKQANYLASARAEANKTGLIVNWHCLPVYET